MPLSTLSGGVSRDVEFFKRKVKNLKDLTEYMMDDLSAMEERFESEFKPKGNALRSKLLQLYQFCLDADRNADVMDVVGDSLTLGGALPCAIGGLLTIPVAPLAPLILVLVGGAAGLLGVGAKHNASKIRSSAKIKSQRIIEQSWKTYTEELKELEKKFNKVFARYSSISSIVGELSDYLKTFTPKFLGENTFNAFSGSFDYTRPGISENMQGTLPQDGFLNQVNLILENITSFLRDILEKIGSIISNLASAMGINIGDDAKFILGVIYKGASLAKDFSKAFSKTVVINPITCLLTAGYDGTKAFLNLKKNILDEGPDSDCVRAIDSIREHLDKQDTLLTNLFDELNPIHINYNSLAEDVNHLEELFNQK